MLNQPFSIVVLVDFVAIGMVCYFCIIVWYGVQHILLREVNEFELQKGKWHTFFHLPFYLYALVFSVLCMI
jgi:hypothetical protein